jgi:ABC-type multidrug transport system fused ATPase/permease subunit
VGRTGAGKSTIYATLLRLVDPCSGEIYLDDKNISDLFVKNLRNEITMIDQEPTLIKGTFRENLDIKNIYTDDELYQILEECNLYDIVMEKDGLDQVIDNNSLSAGEKQLLCICRAFLKKSKIVIIDEATANIDKKNDEIIQKVIREKFKGSTVLTIAHRLSTLKSSDKIIVMGEGRALEFGSPQELE